MKLTFAEPISRRGPRAQCGRKHKPALRVLTRIFLEWGQSTVSPSPACFSRLPRTPSSPATAVRSSLSRYHFFVFFPGRLLPDEKKVSIVDARFVHGCSLSSQKEIRISGLGERRFVVKSGAEHWREASVPTVDDPRANCS